MLTRVREKQTHRSLKIEILSNHEFPHFPTCEFLLFEGSFESQLRVVDRCKDFEWRKVHSTDTLNKNFGFTR